MKIFLVLRNSLENKRTLPLEQIVDGVVKLVEDLDFQNKRHVIQKVVTKVVATKKEVTVWGYVPVLATEKVGLNVINRYSQDATIPFDITSSMPPLDKRTRGYTPKQIKELQETAGGKW